MASTTYIYTVKNASSTNLTPACVLYGSDKETVLQSGGQTEWRITNTIPSALSPCYISYDGEYYKIESSDWIPAGGTTYYVNIDNQTPEGSGDSSTLGKIYLGDKLILERPSYTLDEVSDGSTRKLANYLPLAGGTMTGAGSITYTGDDIAVPLVRNVTRTVSGGWARALANLKVDGGSSFSIVGYGSDYTPGSGSNSITYAYLGFNGYNGDNLRIASDSIKWGNNTIWHAGNDGENSGLDADKLDGQEGSYYAAASSLSSYLPLSAGSSYPLTGDLYLTAGKGIEATGGSGLLVYRPADWSGISNTQWGVGATDSQGVIRSTATDLLHYRGGTNYKVWDAANSGNTDTGWAASGITSGYYTTQVPAGSKWYRIFEFNRGASGGASAIIKISRTYSNSNNESYIFSVNIAYSGAVSITQLSGVANTQLIRKVRVDHRNSDHCFVDFYYDGTVLNGVNISGYGDGTFQAPAEATLVGTAKEFNLITNGLATNGNIVASGTITPGSDTRLKDNQKVIHADSAYSVIEKLTPKTWVWNQLAEGNAGKAGAGLVAQEVKPVLPDAIEVAGDQETGFHSLNYNMIQGYEIAAIKGLIEEVKSLKAEIAELKKQIK